MVRLVGENFIPARVHVRDQREEYKRWAAYYSVLWTPATLILDSDGQERHRIEGFLPAPDFLAELNLGLGLLRLRAHEWSDAQQRLQQVEREFPESEAAPQALYWEGVARYKAEDENNDALTETARAFETRYQDSEWAKKASVWRKKASSAVPS